MLKIFMIRDKKILIYLLTTQKVDRNVFIDQNKIKLKEHDLKYQHLNKCNSKITNSSSTSKSRQ